MVVFLLQVRAQLENVTDFCAPSAASWCLDLKQPDGDEVKTSVVVSPETKVELQGSKGDANCVIKWPDSRREGHITIVAIKGSAAARPFTEDDGNDFVTCKFASAMAFDVRPTS